MNEAEYKKLSLLIKKYCPDFLEEKYPKFIAFLKAYYDWSADKEQFNPWRVISHLIEWGDIDETIDEFINYFKSEYLDNINIDFGGDVREFIKHSKEFYSSRGTPESFRFLLRLLTGNTGSIFYPNQFIMKSSDGEWRRDHNIFIGYSDLIDNSFISTRIKGKYSGVEATIESIETHFNYSSQDRFLKINISNADGILTDDVIVLDNGEVQLEMEVYNTISSLDIVESGNNYKVGDTVYIQDNPTFMGRISSIKPGRIESYAILDGGENYSVGDVIHVKCDTVDYYSALATVYVDEVDPSTGAITSLDIRYSGYGFLEVPVVESIESARHTLEGGTDAVIEFISTGCGAINSIDVISVEMGYLDNTPLIIDSDTGIGAQVILKTGKVYDSMLYYYKPGSFLSDEFKLQDSDYWQDYSYEIQSSLTLDADSIIQFAEFKEIFKQLVHPAGFKLFNSFVLSNHIDMRMLYVNSTIDVASAPSFVELVNWIEMVSHWNRIIDNDIIFQQRYTLISEVANDEIGDYKRLGGDFVHSTIVTN